MTNTVVIDVSLRIRLKITEQSLARCRIQGRERLIEKKNFRFEHERPRQARALGLAAGERARGARRQMCDAQPLAAMDSRRRSISYLASPAQFQSEGGVLINRGVQQQRLLKHRRDAPPELK